MRRAVVVIVCFAAAARTGLLIRNGVRWVLATQDDREAAW